MNSDAVDRREQYRRPTGQFGHQPGAGQAATVSLAPGFPEGVNLTGFAVTNGLASYRVGDDEEVTVAMDGEEVVVSKVVYDDEGILYSFDDVINVEDIDGINDTLDRMTGRSNTWEDNGSTFTRSRDGIVRESREGKEIRRWQVEEDGTVLRIDTLLLGQAYASGSTKEEADAALFPSANGKLPLYERNEVLAALADGRQIAGVFGPDRSTAAREIAGYLEGLEYAPHPNERVQRAISRGWKYLKNNYYDTGVWGRDPRTQHRYEHI